MGLADAALLGAFLLPASADPSLLPQLPPPAASSDSAQKERDPPPGSGGVELGEVWLSPVCGFVSWGRGGGKGVLIVLPAWGLK